MKLTLFFEKNPSPGLSEATCCLDALGFIPNSSSMFSSSMSPDSAAKSLAAADSKTMTRTLHQTSLNYV